MDNKKARRGCTGGTATTWAAALLRAERAERELADLTRARRRRQQQQQAATGKEDAVDGSMLQQVLEELSKVRKTVEMLEFNQQAMERERRQHAQQSSACCIS